VTAQPFRYDVGIAIGILVEPPTRRIAFDGPAALFTDGAYYFVNQKLAEFGARHIPPGFFDCYGGSPLTGEGADELGWFANTLSRALVDYPERWEVADFGSGSATVERDNLRQQLVGLTEIVQRARREGRTVASRGD
jgi:hypothetical protein